MELRLRFPGKAGSDPRFTVTITEPGTPWPLAIHFVLIEDDEDGTREWINVGFEIGERFEAVRGESRTPIDESPVAIDARTLQRIAEDYSTYVELARNALVLNQEGVTGALKRLRPGPKPARLTDDFYRLIAADYEARRRAGEHAVKELAMAQHVDISTASKWIRTARDRGLIHVAEEANRAARDAIQIPIEEAKRAATAALAVPVEEARKAAEEALRAPIEEAQRAMREVNKQRTGTSRKKT